jgi:23S rRNA (uracil1939-C5)-methyltransferase
VELYAGYGPIALRLARAGARVTADERNEAAVADGERAARENGLSDQVAFRAEDARHGLLAAAGEGAAAIDALVLDPPRRGLAPELTDALLAVPVPRVVYVSCNPLTLRRDLEALAPAFAPRALSPVDLFPRTDHVECVALLEAR